MRSPFIAIGQWSFYSKSNYTVSDKQGSRRFNSRHEISIQKGGKVSSRSMVELKRITLIILLEK